MSSSSYSVWVQLYIGKKESGVFEIEPVPKNIGALRKVVKEECQEDLGWVSRLLQVGCLQAWH